MYEIRLEFFNYVFPLQDSKDSEGSEGPEDRNDEEEVSDSNSDSLDELTDSPIDDDFLEALLRSEELRALLRDEDLEAWLLEDDSTDQPEKKMRLDAEDETSNINTNDPLLPSEDSFASTSSDVDEPKGPEEADEPAKRRRCDHDQCNKKLGLHAFPCRCEKFFCAKHMSSFEHNCTFDYKAMAAKEIEEKNPKVEGEKIKKI